MDVTGNILAMTQTNACYKMKGEKRTDSRDNNIIDLSMLPVTDNLDNSGMVGHKHAIPNCHEKGE